MKWTPSAWAPWVSLLWSRSHWLMKNSWLLLIRWSKKWTTPRFTICDRLRLWSPMSKLKWFQGIGEDDSEPETPSYHILSHVSSLSKGTWFYNTERLLHNAFKLASIRWRWSWIWSISICITCPRKALDLIEKANHEYHNPNFMCIDAIQANLLLNQINCAPIWPKWLRTTTFPMWLGTFCKLPTPLGSRSFW